MNYFLWFDIMKAGMKMAMSPTTTISAASKAASKAAGTLTTGISSGGFAAAAYVGIGDGRSITNTQRLSSSSPLHQLQHQPQTNASDRRYYFHRHFNNQQFRNSSHHDNIHLQQKRFFARNNSRHRRRSTNYSGGGDDFDDYTTYDDDDSRTATKNILVIGSSGALGRTLVAHLSKSSKCNVIGADIVNNTHSPETGSTSNYIHLPKEGSLSDLTVMLYRGVANHFQKLEEQHGTSKRAKNKFDAIVCASGGWEGDVDMDDMIDKLASGSSLKDVSAIDVEEEYVKQSAEVVERMMKMNFNPIVAGSQIGHRFLAPGGLFVIIGASAALSPTPGMIGYGSAKSAAHHFLQTWGSTCTQFNDATAVGILPLMLDTPANRSMMGGDENDGDDRYSKMVKPAQIAKEIGEWIDHPHLRPHSGSLVKVIAKNRRDGSGGAAFHLVR